MLTRGWLEVEGYRLRTLLSVPAVASPAPALLYLPPLGDRSLDIAVVPAAEAMAMVLHEASRANLISLRVELSGHGGSGGPGYCDVSLNEEVNIYRAAVRWLGRHPAVDENAIVLFGHSLGGALAPLVADGTHVRGAVVYGAPSRCWSDTLCAAAERQLQLALRPSHEMANESRLAALLYRGLLREQVRPTDLFAAQPALRDCLAARDVIGDTLHGRQLSYFRALERQSPDIAWPRASIPVLALAGEHDWVVAADDHKRIAAFARASRQRAAAHTVAGLDHDMRRYHTRQLSFRQRGVAPLDPAAAQLAIGWIAALCGHPLSPCV